jgi:hypothetical protein
VGLFVQPYKCLAWVSSSLPHGSVKFYYPLDGVKNFGVPFGSTSFASFLLQKVLDEDVQHVNMFLKLGDIQVVFGIIF